MNQHAFQRLASVLFFLAAGCQSASSDQQSDSSGNDDTFVVDSEVSVDLQADGNVHAPVCKIQGNLVDCGLAFADYVTFSPPAGAVGPSSKSACLAVCESWTSGFITHLNLTNQDLTSCVHQITIENFDCSTCPDLSDEPVTQFYCDKDPCTYDACEGSSCSHTPLSWINTPCKTEECSGTWTCNPSANWRFARYRLRENLEVCVPFTPCPD